VERELPNRLTQLGYQDLSIDARQDGSMQVLAAKPASWQSFGHGVRVIIARPTDAAAQTSELRLVLARRFTQNESENLDMAHSSMQRCKRRAVARL
jgi:hypothetical protein